jgi:tRNA(Arg) A34 adenosine deaminase TadA
MHHEHFMRRAVELSREGVRRGAGGPFGAVIVRGGEIVGEGHNCVFANNDPTAHGEVMAIRDACRKAGTLSLEGCDIYTSCAPCPMCLAAIYWARIATIYYGNTAEDASNLGFDDGEIYRQIALDPAARSIPSACCLHEEAAVVFKEWSEKVDRVMY